MVLEMASKIVIVDYGMGNLNSVKKTMDRLKVESVVSSEPKVIEAAQKIILPGIGHFAKAMTNLKKMNLLDALHEAVLIQKKPLLGICLGMQLFAKKSEEGDAEGLGWIDAEVVKFKVSDRFKFKVPQMGWNRIILNKKSELLKNIPDLSEFYFVHSYHIKLRNRADSLSETEFDYVFSSAVEKDNIFGVQFHPEKSHDVGLQLLKNFVDL